MNKNCIIVEIVGIVRITKTSVWLNIENKSNRIVDCQISHPCHRHLFNKKAYTGFVECVRIKFVTWLLLIYEHGKEATRAKPGRAYSYL